MNWHIKTLYHTLDKILVKNENKNASQKVKQLHKDVKKAFNPLKAQLNLCVLSGSYNTGHHIIKT